MSLIDLVSEDYRLFWTGFNWRLPPVIVFNITTGLVLDKDKNSYKILY